MHGNMLCSAGKISEREAQTQQFFFFYRKSIVFIVQILKLPLHSAAKSLQSCPTLCNPIDDSPPGSPVPGILQARTLEWVAISFSNS